MSEEPDDGNSPSSEEAPEEVETIKSPPTPSAAESSANINAANKYVTDRTFNRRHDFKTGADVDDKFDVKIPKASYPIFIIIGAILTYGMVYYIAQTAWWIVLIFFALSVIPILLWGKIGTLIGENNILKWVKDKVVKKKPLSPVEILVGYPSTKNKYYIEANSIDLDGNEWKLIMGRVFNTVFLAVGLSVLISEIVSYVPGIFSKLIIEWGYIGNSDVELDCAVFMGPFAMILLFFFQPMFWMAEDSQIYRIDQYQDIHKIGDYFKTGLLSKILGVAGILLIFNTAVKKANDYIQNYLNPGIGYTSNSSLGFGGLIWTPPMGTASTATILDLYSYANGLWFFIWVLAASAVIPLIVTIIYLAHYHEGAVNILRIRASEFLPVATAEVNIVGEEEKEWLGHLEKVDTFRAEKITKGGMALLIALFLIGSIVCIYFAFFF